MKFRQGLKITLINLWSFFRWKTGGEPNLIEYYQETGEYAFYDCSHQSPSGRRNLCYDRDALEKRKNRPEGNLTDMAFDMGIELLTENEYRPGEYI
jgi:hypothetical protein